MAIRRSVYIGLGGTGIMAISHAKKLFEDAYGKNNIPYEVAFAAIDFDLSAADNTALATDMKDDFLSLNGLGNPRTLYKAGKNKGKYEWMPENNAGFMAQDISEGASQVRTTGRFYCEMIQEPIVRRISECINQVTNITNPKRDNIIPSNFIDIHIVMSLAGGTGSGSFLNVAKLLRSRINQQLHIVGYGVLDGVFRTMDPARGMSPRVVANAYSAILDLDYLMTVTPSAPIKISFNGKEELLDTPLYDEFYAIDNETEKGDRVKHVNKLCEAVGTCMFAGGTDIGTKVRSLANNNGWQVGGNYDIYHKKGWVQALGACQVVYKGELLAQVYSLMAANNLIQNLLNTTITPNKEAVEWAKSVQIKEDEADDQMIDSIYNIATAKFGLPLTDIKDTMSATRSTVDRYTSSMPEYPSDKAIEERIQEIKDKLSDKVVLLLNGENGVGNVLAFLDSLKTNVIKYRSEMDAEVEEKESGLCNYNTQLENAFKDYEEYSGKMALFKKSSVQQEYLDNVSACAKSLLKEKLEIARRKEASKAFTAILTDINNHITQVNDYKDRFITLQKEYKEQCADLQNQNNSALVFEYDLSAQERIDMSFNPGEEFVSGYFLSLNDKSLYELDIKSELGNSILAYCEALPETKAFKTKLLVDVIDDLNNEQYDKLKKEIEKKSSRLLCLDDRGETMPTHGDISPVNAMVQNYFIAAYQRNNDQNRLEKDRNFLRNIGSAREFIHTEYESMKQKMIFYRSDMAIIPYCIKAFSEHLVEKEYGVMVKDANTFNPHCDAVLFEQMREKDFKLKPEMTNEADFYWVCGQLFGWAEVTEQQYIMEKDNNGIPVKIQEKVEISHPKYIRCSKGKYEYWDENKTGATLKGKWSTLGTSATSQRDKAYNYFKTIVLPELKPVLKSKIQGEVESRGKAIFVNMIKEIISDGYADYIDKIACTDKNSITYDSKNSEETKCFEREWNYIKNYLINSIENLR